VVHRIRNCRRDADNADLAEPLDAEQITVVRLVDKDDPDVVDVRVHWHMIIGDVGIDDAAEPVIDQRFLVQRHTDTPDHAAQDLAARGLRVQDAPCGNRADDARDADHAELLVNLHLDEEFAAVEKRLEEAPPVQFDIARQVRVFNAYFQYVELKLSGAAIQRHRLAIPPSIQKLGGSKDLEGRLRTTFDLIEKGGKLSSKALEDALNEIRKDFTRSLGKDHGRVVLKAAKPHLEGRLAKFRGELKAHQEKAEKELQGQLDESRKQIVDYFLPQVVASPPDAMRGQFLKFSDDEARAWLAGELDRVFPKAEALIQKMQLDVRYKDVTFETLNQEDFLGAIKVAYPGIDWEKAYKEFRAAGEKEKWG
jgi:hypothetical protein